MVCILSYTFSLVPSGRYARVNALKEDEPGLKTLLSVGGATFELEKMSQMLATEENRTEFIETSIDYLRQYDFDGLDMDWEYPGYTEGGSVPEDKERFTLLLQVCNVLVIELLFKGRRD